MPRFRMLWLYMLDPPWRHSEPEPDPSVKTDYGTGPSIGKWLLWRMRRRLHWYVWVAGWLWAVAGLVLGALVAPLLLKRAGLSDTQYQDWIVIGVAVLAGFLVQFLSWCFLIPSIVFMGRKIDDARSYRYLPEGAELPRDESGQVDTVKLVFLHLQAEERYMERPAVLRFLAEAVLPELGTVTYYLAPLVPLVAVAYGIYRYLTWVGTGQSVVTIAFVGGLLIKTFAIPFIKGVVTGAMFRWFMKWLRGGKETKKTA